jgi:hypothetical protein
MEARRLWWVPTLLPLLLVTAWSGRALAQPAIPRDRYLAYVRAAADRTWEGREALIARWRETFDPDSPFGYRPPGSLLETALIYAWLYEQEGVTRYVDRAKQILLEYGDWRAQYPARAAAQRPDYADGVPALPDFFTVMRYIRAYDTLHRKGRLTPAETAAIEGIIAHSMEYLLRSAEWGTMNRAVLRAESLAWAVRAMPGHVRTPVWEMQRRALGDDNWGNWEIEDATIYHGVWLYSLMGYADAQGRLDELFRTPEVYYYADYFLNLMCPAGFVPDFGDAQWTSNWQHYLVFFEAAAARYHDGRYKWAAQRLAERFIDFEQPAGIGLACFLLDCYRWGSDEVAATVPTSGSAEVMEDVQGKKIVFRDGWGPRDDYLLLTYRDEGDGGLNFRDYLRDTIPVEEEKMTHGHADENSIPLLMSGGSVLLHDGGYRDYMPSGPYGAYRQDYFHNRLVVRPEKIFLGQQAGEWRYSHREAVPGQSILEFVRDAGSYRPVRTRKWDFISLPDFDYSRTRLIDDGWGYDWDRVVVFVQDPGLFVVFDIFKARTEEYFTLADLWHTRRVLDSGEGWYDTVYDRIQNAELPQDRHLLILFPQRLFRVFGTEPEQRHYQEETLIHQTTAHHFELGETEGMVTVLIPHDAAGDPRDWVGRVHLVETLPERTALAVAIEYDGRTILVGARQDLRLDMVRDWRRPRYTYEAGRVRYGEIETNGDLLFAVEQGEELSYTITNLTRATWGEQVLYDGQSSYFGLAFDASPETSGVGKMRYWRGTVRRDH